MDLTGKNVLLIAPSFFGYEMDITYELNELGANVMFENADPGTLLSTLINGIRHFNLSSEWIVKVFENRIYSRIQNKKFDIVFVICGWAITSRLLKKIRCHILASDGKMYLYYWDSIALLKDDTSRWLLFDKIYTFDKTDYEKYSHIMQFLPLFYNRKYRSIENNSLHKYNLATIGSFKYDRYFLIEKLKVNNPAISIFSFLYISRCEFMLHKLRKKYWNVKESNLSHRNLNADELMAIYANSDAILDMPRTGQNGLTMRVFECLAMNKKIITTNEHVKEYEFYNSSNIYVLSRVNLELPTVAWFNTPYMPLKNSILQKYSIQNWIKTILGEV